MRRVRPAALRAEPGRRAIQPRAPPRGSVRGHWHRMTRGRSARPAARASGASGNAAFHAATKCARYRRDASTGETFATSVGSVPRENRLMTIDLAVGKPALGGSDRAGRHFRRLAMCHRANGVGSPALPGQVVGSAGLLVRGGKIEKRWKEVARFDRRGGDELRDRQHLYLRLLFVERRIREHAVGRPRSIPMEYLADMQYLFNECARVRAHSGRITLPKGQRLKAQSVALVCTCVLYSSTSAADDAGGALSTGPLREVEGRCLPARVSERSAIWRIAGDIARQLDAAAVGALRKIDRGALPSLIRGRSARRLVQSGRPTIGALRAPRRRSAHRCRRRLIPGGSR